MTLWIRYEHLGRPGFGSLEATVIQVHRGDLFEAREPTGETRSLSEVVVRPPSTPSKFFGLVNNFRAAIEKQGAAVPAEPLYFMKSSNTFRASGEPIRLPAQDLGKIIYEGELGVVIGREARNVAEADADRHIFGYTCVNDVTAVDLINRDPTYAQWTRAKNFDSFGPFGPVIATGIDPMHSNVRTALNGKVRQDYPLSDMVFSPRALVSLISRDVTLLPGDVIACGTSLGIGVLKPKAQVEVVIEGIGTLFNPIEGPGHQS